MTSRFGLIPLSGILVGVSATILVTTISLFAFGFYVSHLQKSAVSILHQALFSANNIIIKAPNAMKSGSRFLASSFRPELIVVFIDESHRVVLSREIDANGVSHAHMNVRGRVDRSGEPKAPDALSRVIDALAGVCGFQTLRSHIRDVEVNVALNQEVFAENIREVLPFFCIAIVITVFISFVGTRLLTYQALRPLLDVTTALEHLAVGDFTPQLVNIEKQGQLRMLAAAYNGAVEQLQSAFHERDKAHVSMQRFIADAGHQLRTPLTVIRGYIGILRRGDISDLRVIVDQMNQQCLLIEALVDRLILLERWEEDVDRPVHALEIGKFAEEIISPITQSHPDRLLNVEVRNRAYAAIAPEDLRHAVMNIIDNALKYTRGSISVNVSAQDEWVFMKITDEGPGLKAEQKERVFDRFFRGDRREIEGSGLGLAIAKRAVERAGGQITLDTGIDRGSCFAIALRIVTPSE